MINLTQLNEFLNLSATAMGIIPVAVYFSKKKLKWANYIILFLGISTILDVITFIIYKFYNQDSYWLTPFYIFNNIILISLFTISAIKDNQLSKILKLFSVFSLLFASVWFMFFSDLNNYDRWIWLFTQLIILTILSLFMYDLFKNSIISLQKNSSFFIAVGLSVIFLVPILSSLLQYELNNLSPNFFTYSLLVINISSIISYLIILKGITLLRKA
jgi:hypothetical protein